MKLKKDDMKKKIGKKIAELRKSNGWTQTDLARATFKTKQNIDRLERGDVNPTLFTMYELSFALGVPIRKLVEL